MENEFGGRIEFRPQTVIEEIKKFCECERENGIAVLISANSVTFWEAFIRTAHKNSILYATLCCKNEKLGFFKNKMMVYMRESLEKALMVDVRAVEYDNGGEPFDIFKDVGTLLGRRLAVWLNENADVMRDVLTEIGTMFRNAKICTPDFNLFKGGVIVEDGGDFPPMYENQIVNDKKKGVKGDD